jgi:CTP-dependent riboflavin kinase
MTFEGRGRRHDVCVLLRGRVASGVGDLSKWMALRADAYAEKTGVRLLPGSLNVVLDHPWRVADASLRPEPPEYGVGMSIVPCRVEGIPAFILRTDDNNEGRGDHPPNVVEIAAAVHLRQALGLADGDEVEINVLGA